MTKQSNHLLHDCNIWKDRPVVRGGKGKGKAKDAVSKDNSEDSDNDSMDEDKVVLLVSTTPNDSRSVFKIATGQPCILHSTPAKPAGHFLRNFPLWGHHLVADEDYSKDEAAEPEDQPQATDSYDSSVEDPNVLHVFTTTNKSEEKSILRVVNAKLPPVP